MSDAIERLRELLEQLRLAVAGYDIAHAAKTEADKLAGEAYDLRERLHDIEPREALLNELLASTHDTLKHTGAVATCMFEPCRRLAL